MCMCEVTGATILVPFAVFTIEIVMSGMEDVCKVLYGGICIRNIFVCI